VDICGHVDKLCASFERHARPPLPATLARAASPRGRRAKTQPDDATVRRRSMLDDNGSGL